MRISHNESVRSPHRRPMGRIRFEQRAEVGKNDVAQMPQWRRTFVGYCLTLPIVVVTALATLFIQHLLKEVYFPGSLLFLAVLLISIFWGVGPALLSVLLSTLFLAYIILPHLGHSTIENWQDAIQLVPFLCAGLIIALITAQRERARVKALTAERELQAHIGALEETNQKLEDANQTKDRFLSIASHELKTPITTIRGQAQLGLRRLSKLPQLPGEMIVVRSSLEKVNEQTGRLTMLIEELLDVSSIRAGKVELRKKESDIGKICLSVVEDHRLLTGRVILLDLPASPICMEVDQDRFAQVLVNLVSNAVKYSPEQTSVEVSLREEERHVRIEVRDHGKGVAKSEQERIFETFYRTPDAEASVKRGLGLGLAISKDIVERHHGRIWCESELGKGSSFFVELPLDEGRERKGT